MELTLSRRVMAKLKTRRSRTEVLSRIDLLKCGTELTTQRGKGIGRSDFYYVALRDIPIRQVDRELPS
jgi:hypothetical protein